MKLRSFAGAITLLALAACATAPTTYIGEQPPPGGGPENPLGGEPGPAEDEDDVTKQPPHSLGVILLGESHTSSSTGTTTSKSTPIVSASFYPDALLTKTCRKTLEAGCTIQEVPKCDSSTTSANGCLSGETCTYDDNCKPVCQKPVTCTTACAEDEVCKATQPGTASTSGTCVKKESFDAGPLAFSGTTTSITMYPPYAFEGDGQGAPFLAGVELRVQAQGAAEAGFEKFDEKFKATTFLQTSPALGKIPRDKVFGTGPLPVTWTKGEDTILITLSGMGGTATCKVKDADGKFDVPRNVVKAALGTPAPGTEGVAQSLSMSVARVRKEVRKDKKAKGSIALTKFQPNGWLELTTMSTESTSFQGCASTQTICGATCCSSGYTCDNGTCKYGGGSASCDSCVSSYCSSYNSTCLADSYCSALKTCMASCTTTTCQSSCRSSYPSGTTKYDSLASCKSTYCSSSCTTP